MGIQLNGTSGTDIISAVDGSLTVEGLTVAGTGTFTGVIDAQGYINLAQKIIHTGDADTSIEFPSNDTIKFETAGNERVRITSLGKVGIGTDNPSQPVSIANGRVNIDAKNDHYGVWADGDTAGENHISVGRWYNTGGGLKSGYSQYGINK